MNIIGMLLKDGYKVGHKDQYPDGITEVFSNFTPRAGRDPKDEGVVLVGPQRFVAKWLVEYFDDNFFGLDRNEVMYKYTDFIDDYLGQKGNYDHIGALHDLGHLPIEIRCLPEGTFVPYGIPVMTIRNTHPDFAWLPNALETLISCELWHPITSATASRKYRKAFMKYARLTGSPVEFTKFQGHDFSMRGMPGVEAAASSGIGHLVHFLGTDTLPAIHEIRMYYGGDQKRALIGCSVNATEHSVMCAGGKESELETYRRLLKTYPTGILSIVSDTWDYWKVLTEILPALKDEILARDGKLVIRPDSGVPHKIVNGDDEAEVGSPAWKGSLILLVDTFGYTENEEEFDVLNPKIGLIYGEGITLEEQDRILDGMAEAGWASENIVMGIGSYAYQYVTRDTHGFAMKATHVIIREENVEIFKDPKTDSGLKKSARGYLRVDRIGDKLSLSESVSFEDSLKGELRTIFCNGTPYNFQTFEEIRAIAEGNL